MLKISIFWKIILLFLAYLFLVNGIMLLFYFLTESPETITSDITKAVITDASVITKNIEDEIKNRKDTRGVKSLEEIKILKGIVEKKNRHVRVLNLSGDIIFETPLEEGRRSEKLTEKEIIEIQKRGFLIGKGHATFFRSTIEITKPLRVEGKTMGLVQVSYPKTNPSRLQKVISFAVVIEAIVIALLAMLFSKWFSIPIRELIKAAEQIAKGNLGYHAVVKSSDEIGELTNTFNYMSKTLADMTKLRRELTADISHELRSPLTRIRVSAESLVDKVVDDENEKEMHLQAICEEVDDLNSLIGDLLDLSKLELDRIKMEYYPTSLKELVNGVLTKMTPLIKKRKASVEVDIGENIPDILLDGKGISRVMANLLDNSLKFTNSDGRIKVSVYEKDDFINVDVEDNGKGIPENELPFIFERFYRVDKSRTRETGGTGLGLAIAKQIVKAHGGEIFAQSKVGDGTKISFTLSKKRRATEAG